jgi:tRNA (guanine37-N1)-methyltransferase
MVMTVQPIDACITHLKAKEPTTRLFICRLMETLNQKMANTMSMYENIIIFGKSGPART